MQHFTTPGEFFTGSVSDVRVFSRALTTNEIVILSQPLREEDTSIPWTVSPSWPPSAESKSTRGIVKEDFMVHKFHFAALYKTARGCLQAQSTVNPVMLTNIAILALPFVHLALLIQL